MISAASGCGSGGGDDDGDDGTTTFTEVQAIAPDDSLANSAPSLAVTALDYDGDDDLDLITVGGVGGLGTWSGGIALLQNDGSGQFTDVTQASGLAGGINLTNASAFDYDNDGDEDLFISAMQTFYDSTDTLDAKHFLYRNEGDGTFADVTEAAGIDVVRSSESVAFGDIDNDGYLDIYLPQHIDNDFFLAAAFDPGNLDASSFGSPDLLFHNNGDGTFTEESETRGVGVGNGGSLAPSGRPLDDITLVAMFFDYDHDGDQDLLAGNDIGYAYLYQNDGTGHFSDVSADVGLIDIGWGGWMGYAPIDMDGDGTLEVMAANFGVSWLSHDKGTLLAEPDDVHPYASVFKFDGGSVTNIAPQINATDMTAFPVRRTDLPPPTAGSLEELGFAWSVSGFDYDNDGLTDLYQTGALPFGPDSGIGFTLDLGGHPGQLLRQTSVGNFAEVTHESGLSTITGNKFDPTWGHTFGDLNGDGFVDVVVAVMTMVPGTAPGRLRIFMNDGNTNHYVALKLHGTTSNRDGLGAIVRLYTDEGGAPQVRGAFAQGWTYARDAVRFGIGQATAVARVEIDWPSGGQQVLTDVAIDQVVEVTEP